MRQADNFFFVLTITAWARERPGDSSGQRERERERERERGAGAADCLVISSRVCFEKGKRSVKNLKSDKTKYFIGSFSLTN